MINKRSLWFLTLFSLILVLSIYYITMPNDLLSDKELKTLKTGSEVEDKATIKESELLVTMRVNLEEERNSEVKDLKDSLTKEEVSSDEKNEALEKIKYITNLTAKENDLEKRIKKEYNIDSFIKINNNEIKVVAIKKDHDINLANNIMKLIQSSFEDKKTITIQFEK